MSEAREGDWARAAIALARVSAIGSKGLLLLGAPADTSLGSAFAHTRVVIPQDADDWDMPDESFDGAVVLGTLERTPWDRWRLQEVHRVVRAGGCVALRVPRLDMPPSLGALAYLAGRVADRVGRRITRRSRRFSSRRYSRRQLTAMLRSLHFHVESWSHDGFGGGASRATPLHDHHYVVARREAGLAARLRMGQPPDPTAFIAAYESEHARFVEIRRQWCERHASLARVGPDALSPASYGRTRVLVLAPHADDELVGSAGTIRRLVDAGASVRVIHATDGSAGAALHDAPEAVRTTIRLEEAERVGAALGVARLDFWRQDNRNFVVTPANVQLMREVLEEFQPGVVISPFVTDIHPDHFTLNAILEQALPQSRGDWNDAEIWYSEIWSLVPANFHADVTDLEEEVERLIRMYTTAMKIDDLPHLCEARYYYNACRLLKRPGFVEAFHRAPLREHATYMSAARRD